MKFNVHAFLDAANELVRLDEVERGLDLLDNLPAYYRDNPPEQVTRLRNEILARVCTPTTYAKMDVDNPTYDVDKGQMEQTLRGMLILAEVKWLNERGLKPRVIDLAPGEHWVKGILDKAKCSFYYETISLKSFSVKPIVDKDVPIIFLALELIEHLWNEKDLKIESLKCSRLPDIIHISTPQYAFDPNCPDWRVRPDLGHLRAYTPREFQDVVAKHFPEYHMLFYSSDVMQVRLTLKGTTYPDIAHHSMHDILPKPTSINS